MCVPVTTVWVSPGHVREIDAPIVAVAPDATAWLAALDAVPDRTQGRIGLHGRVETQLVDGEPVRVIARDASGEWSQVLAPWQPCPESEHGYPGWVPSAHLRAVHGTGQTEVAGEADHADTAGLGVTPGPVDNRNPYAGNHPALTAAREHLGLPYLWGGATPLGFDCSGLVHFVWRHLGVVVPRDAHAQAAFARPVELDAVHPGDLYFFARPQQRIHHVGIVVARGHMVHAPETDALLTDETLSPERTDTLVAAGRLPLPGSEPAGTRKSTSAPG